MIGFVSNDNVSNFVSGKRGSRSQNSCILLPVKIILSKFGRNSCKFSPIRLQIKSKFKKKTTFTRDREKKTMSKHLHDTIIIEE